MTTPLLALHKIFLATEGEGINLGLPEVFVRLQGCAIACHNCDTPAALPFTQPNQSVNDILAKIKEFGIKRISLTGGDPLALLQRPGVKALCQALKTQGYWINLEAHGLTPLDDAAEIYDLVDFISADFKTPSCGHPGKVEILRALCQKYPSKLQIKSVIFDETDFAFVLAAHHAVSPWPQEVAWVLTPAYNLGEAFPHARIEQIYHWNYNAGGKFRVIVQQHKVVFGTQRDDV